MMELDHESAPCFMIFMEKLDQEPVFTSAYQFKLWESVTGIA